MKDLLLVDGYNVINASSQYRAIKESDLEAARVRLVEDVAGYAKLAGAQAVVVFDASRRSGASERSSSVLGVRVIFTREGRSADETIERMAHDARRGRRVFVATSDYAQQKTVFAEGVLRMSSGELLARIGEEKSEVKEHTRKGPRRVFLEDRLDADAREALRKLARE